MRSRILRALAAILCLAAITLDAAPFRTWDWQGPKVYENGEPIIADLLVYVLHCGTSPGGPYTVSIPMDLQTPPSLQDMEFVVGGMPGEYYCALTARSTLFGSTSNYSNDQSFIVTPASRGYVPTAPVLILLDQ